MKKFLTVLAATVAMAAAAERRPFERYQSIVDRQMFGEPPPGFDPTKPPSEVQKSEGKGAQELTREQEQLKSAVHFSVINVTPEGATAVGFTDNSDPKSPKHYYLRLGEERDGWLVKEADPAEKSMLIVKGAVELALKLGENSAGGGAPAQAAAAGGGQPGGLLGRRRGLLGGLRPGGGPNAGVAPGAAAGADLNSLRGRRMMRQEQERQAREADETAKAEAAQRKAEEERQAAEEKERQAKEREEQRAQLQAIQEELRRAREARQQREQQESAENGGSAGESE